MSDPGALSQNLRRLRDARKLSQEEVAEKAQMSRIAYGNIEGGRATPRVDTLVRIASALDVGVQDLLAPVRILRSVRFRAAKKMTSREQLLASVGRWLDDYSELERLLREPTRFSPALNRVARDFGKQAPGRPRATAAAAAVRKALKLAPGEGIRDICGLLEDRAGVKVFATPIASPDFFGLSIREEEEGGPAIVVNTWDRISVERWIFTAAHELGHLLLHRGAYDIARTDENEQEEQEANWFASELLMPHDVFASEWTEASGLPFLDRVFKLKRIFRVSYRTVLYRLSENKSAGGAVWGWFQVAYRERHGESLHGHAEPDALDAAQFAASSTLAAGEPKRLTSDDFVEDRLLRLVRRAYDEQKISLGRAAEILDIELREMRAMAAGWR
jgi:Zn-dependent peptidase ImmA (M78 family)/DNA-binding XRE family transcriptional regulator